jgi:hypothetical protein
VNLTIAKVVYAVLATIAVVSAAHAFGLGMGNQFGRMGAAGMAGSAASPPVSCASTGVFDLSNVCNDIYLLTGSL